MLNSNTVRTYILRSLAASGSGHLGGSLGIVEITSAIFNHFVNFDSTVIADSLQLPKTEQLQLAIQLRSSRDKFLLSAGHLAPCLYAILAARGDLDSIISHKLGLAVVDDVACLGYLQQIRTIEGDLEGHPSIAHLPFLVDGSTGPLGQGAGTSLGYAWTDLKNGTTWKTFALLGDGECQEGQVWEAAMLAAKLKLHNLTWIIDRNFIQIDGPTEEIGGLDHSTMPTTDISGLAQKFASFGWIVRENLTGNRYQACQSELTTLISEQSLQSLPGVLINYSQVGYPFPEFNNYKWHGKTPSAEQADAAVQFLQNQSKNLA